jgi:hypothetical protein
MRDASVGALSRVPAQAFPAVPRATPVDPIFTAIERDRIPYFAFGGRSPQPLKWAKPSKCPVQHREAWRRRTKAPSKAEALRRLLDAINRKTRQPARCSRRAPICSRPG